MRIFVGLCRESRLGGLRLAAMTLLLSTSLSVSSGLCWKRPLEADEILEPHALTVENAIGEFDENDVLHNDTEPAYTLPDIGAFVTYYPETGDLATGISVELHDRRNRRGLLNWFKWDLQISEQRLGLAIGRKVIPVIDITVSAVWSRDFDLHENMWGLSFGLVKF